MRQAIDPGDGPLVGFHLACAEPRRSHCQAASFNFFGPVGGGGSEAGGREGEGEARRRHGSSGSGGAGKTALLRTLGSASRRSEPGQRRHLEAAAAGAQRGPGRRRALWRRRPTATPAPEGQAPERRGFPVGKGGAGVMGWASGLPRRDGGPLVISVNLACVSVRLRAGERHGLAAYLLLRHAIGSDLTPGGKASRLATLSEESKKRSERLPPLKSPGNLDGMLLHSLGVCTLYSLRPCHNLPFTDTLSTLARMSITCRATRLLSSCGDVGEDEEIGHPISFPAIGPLFSVT